MERKKKEKETNIGGGQQANTGPSYVLAILARHRHRLAVLSLLSSGGKGGVGALQLQCDFGFSEAGTATRDDFHISNYLIKKNCENISLCRKTVKIHLLNFLRKVMQYLLCSK